MSQQQLLSPAWIQQLQRTWTPPVELGPSMPRQSQWSASGLGFIADEVGDPIRISYSTIPGFPEPGVAGHKGELVAGRLEGVHVLVQAGRFHLYEGHSATVAALPTEVFAELGIEILIVTNAAGGVRRTFPGGTLMLIVTPWASALSSR